MKYYGEFMTLGDKIMSWHKIYDWPEISVNCVFSCEWMYKSNALRNPAYER